MVTQVFNCLTGLAEIQLIPLDPLVMTKVTIQDGAGRPVSINLELNNVKNTGLSQTDIKAVRYVACSVTTIPRIWPQ
jgi:metal-dependent HD superfamily phosphatase/phosphodiesterase